MFHYFSSSVDLWLDYSQGRIICLSLALNFARGQARYGDSNMLDTKISATKWVK